MYVDIPHDAQRTHVTHIEEFSARTDQTPRTGLIERKCLGSLESIHRTEACSIAASIL
jgi:hypothetical protein